jgi:hypothetical protein
MNEFPEDLKLAFRDYRELHADPEPSVNFTPMVWAKIEARRSSFAVMQRLSQALAGMAIAAALILGVFVIPQMQEQKAFASSSYAEVVAADDAVSEQEVATAFTVPVANVEANGR